MSAPEAAACMHNRLHAGNTRLRALPTITADAPSSLAQARHGGCDACTEANATRHPHDSTLYKASYPGRLIHADIAGPFVRTQFTGFQYVLVLVDDHTRFKAVHFLKNKSEAPAHVRGFLASFTALLNKRSTYPQRVVGTLHSDNAGEFLSREFTDFLADAGIHNTTCPPHVHQLNGVAERAIRFIMELTRLALVASSSPIAFWDFAMTHAVDVLNRTSGPPNTNAS
eukprot:2429359-Pleurochrysis_carterae.AAC.1